MLVPDHWYTCHAGKGIVGEQSLCFSWFARSSNQYVPEATYKLAQCKEDGWGCAVNMQEAVALYREAADGMFALCMLADAAIYIFGMHRRQSCDLAYVYNHASAAFSKSFQM